MLENMAGWGWNQRLKSERSRLRLTQAELATRTGISGSTQIGYEQGVRTPGLSYLVALQQIGVDAWYVMFGTRAERRASEALDWELFADIQEAVVEWCRKKELELQQRKLLEVSRLLYEQFIADRAVQPDAVERILMLVA